MIARLRSGLKNLALVCASMVSFLLLCEFVVFRFILPATDMPRNAYIDDVIRYAPDQRGISRFRDGFEAPYAINRQGWNSGTSDYVQQRTPGIGRIAVIGDSYVEAFQVPFDSSFAELTQQGLRDHGCPVEVYRFGMSGAPLSQYLHVLRREVIKYRPDWIIVLLIHNDFTESFEFNPGRYTSSFLKLKIDNGSVIGEIPPTPYHEGLDDRIRLTATARYFLYTRRVNLKFLETLMFGAEPHNYAANIDLDSAMARLNDIRVATDYVVSSMVEIASSHNIHLLYIMDGDRQAIYQGNKDVKTSGPLALNQIVSEVAELRAVPFIDLHEHFAEDWAKNGLRFEHEHESHWNARANRLAADVLTDYFLSGQALRKLCPTAAVATGAGRAPRSGV
jgi:hypothetical protein